MLLFLGYLLFHHLPGQCAPAAPKSRIREIFTGRTDKPKDTTEHLRRSLRGDVSPVAAIQSPGISVIRAALIESQPTYTQTYTQPEHTDAELKK